MRSIQTAIKPIGWLFSIFLCLPIAPADAQTSGLLKVPPPATGISTDSASNLEKQKQQLDKRVESIEILFRNFNGDCRKIDSDNPSQIADCKLRRNELIEFANAYWRAYCSYKTDNLSALDIEIGKRRAVVREKQEQIRKIGIGTTAQAYQDWSDLSQKQLKELKKEGLEHIVKLTVNTVLKVAGSRSLVQPIPTEKIAEALRKKGVDAVFIKHIASLQTAKTVDAQKASIQFMADWIVNHGEIAYQAHEYSTSSDQYDKLWAATQALVSVTDGVVKVAEAAGATRMPGVGIVATGAASAINISGHYIVGEFWTHQGMRDLAALEEFQLIQVKIAGDAITNAVDRLNTVKTQLPAYSGDARCTK